MRLNAFLARAGVASRRSADELIKAGRVTVNGGPGQLNTVVGAHDRVEVDGEEVTRQRLRYVLLHKPAGVVTTARDPQGRPTVVELVPEEPRVVPVGRLDVDTTDECGVIHTVTFRLESGQGLSAIQLHIDYSSADGDILGNGRNAACELLVPVLSAVNLAGGFGYLNVAMITLGSFSAPADLVRCQYRGRTAPTVSDFAITIVDATDVDGNEKSGETAVVVVPQ